MGMHLDGNIDDCDCETCMSKRQETLLGEIERLRREKRYFALVANWFALNQPGVEVPEWCNLVWRSGEPVVDDEQLEISEAAEELERITPPNAELLKLVDKYPPPQEWFDGEEEQLFSG